MLGSVMPRCQGVVICHPLRRAAGDLLFPALPRIVQRPMVERGTPPDTRVPDSSPSSERLATLAGQWTPSGAEHPASLGEYRIPGLLGSGGMGTVYAAEQENPKRTVALKVIRAEVASGDAMRRFAREAEALGRLQHPGIARIYAAGTADGVPYFAMELVRGRALIDYARTDSADLGARMELFAKICDAVQYAHQRGVIHRDLKPPNILVDDTGQPKILDFGVARLTESESGGTLKTDVGVVVGTLQYMSPEQVAGDPLEIDTRSDIYALGVILYELLAEQLPYSWKGGGIAQAAHTIMMTEPASLGSINRRFRGDIETIAAKALEKDKSRRYAAAADLASDVRRYLRDEPISARPVSTGYQLRKLVRRHRGVFVGLAVAALALVVGSAVSVAMAIRANAASELAETRRAEAVAAQALADQRRGEAERGRSAADAARLAADSARQDAVAQRGAAIVSSKRAEAEASKALATSSFLEDMLKSTNPEVTDGRSVTIKDVVDRAGRALASGRLADQPTVRADVYVTLGRTYSAVAAFDSALVYFDSGYSIRARTLGSLHPSTVTAFMLGGEIFNAKRDLPAGEKRYRAALDLARQIRPARPDLVVEAMRRLGMMLELSQREAEAESLGTAAVALARQSKVSDTTTIYAVQTLAEIRTFSRRPREAEPLWREVVAFNRRTNGDSSSATLAVVYGLANNLFSQGRYEETEALLRPALPAMRAVYGLEHPTVASVLDRFGMSLVRLNRREEGIPHLRESLAMRLKILGERHPDVQLVRVSLGRALQDERRYAEAESLFTAARRERAAMFGGQNGAVASSTDDLAGLALARGNYVDAIRQYRAAIAIWQAARLPQFEILSRSSLGEALTRADSLDEAERVLDDTFAKQRAALGATHNDVLRTAHRLADALRRRGTKLQVADSLLRAVLAGRRNAGWTGTQLFATLDGLARVREQLGDTASAEPFIREIVMNTSAARPANDSVLVERKVWLARTLCAMGKGADGERVAREILNATPAVDATGARRARATIDTCARSP